MSFFRQFIPNAREKFLNNFYVTFFRIELVKVFLCDV